MPGIHRGEIWWADQPIPRRSEPGTSNTDLADAPGNILLPARSTGLPRESAVNVSQLLTLDRTFLSERAATLPPRIQRSVDEGLRLVLQL